jgi:hypothetical protein
MPLIVVGGSGRGVGKTSLLCGLLAALAEFRWTAVKVTSHAHGKDASIMEERAPGLHTDTGRYLRAGAHRAFLVTAQEDRMEAVAQQLWERIESSAPLILESNRIVDYCQPDVCLAVDGQNRMVGKPTYAKFLAHADAVVMRSQTNREEAAARPIFHLEDLERISPAMLAWLREQWMSKVAGKSGT